MRHLAVSISLAAGLTCVLAGCSSSPSMSGNPGNTPPPAGAVPVSLSIHDNPPANVTILRFKVLVTAATLTPADTTQPPVNMILSPQGVELIHLQSESALLANLMVPAGQYTGLSATFANPEMTIFNQTGQTLTVGTQSCPANQVCMIMPALNQATAMVQAPAAPFPLTLSATAPLALLLHFDVNASVQNDLSVTPTIDLAPLPVPPTARPERMHLIGIVSAVSSPTFTLQVGLSGQTSTISTDSNTQFDFGGSCMAENFSCLMTGQVVETNVNVLSDGTLDASKVKLLQPRNHPALLGTIVGVNVAQNQFQFVIGDRECGPQQFPQAAMGIAVTVQLAASATFTVDSDGVTLPPGVSFASVQDLMVGQTVEFQPQLPVSVSGTPPNVQLTISAAGVQLEPSQLTATVSAVNASATPAAFVLGMLPPLFTGANVSMIQVDVVAGTQFDDASGIGSLSTGQKVSVSGLLFNTPTQPTIVAEEVKLRAADGQD